MKAFKTLTLTVAMAFVTISTSAIGVERAGDHAAPPCDKDCRIQSLRKELSGMPTNDLFYTQMIALDVLSPKTFDVASRVMIIEKLDEIYQKLDHAVFD